MPKLTLRTNEEMGFCFVKGQIFHLQNSLEKIGFIKTQAGLSLTYDARRKTFRTSHTILRSYASCAAGITSSTYATPTKLTACPSLRTLCAGELKIQSRNIYTSYLTLQVRANATPLLLLSL